jgi:hypothetical protein
VEYDLAVAGRQLIEAAYGGLTERVLPGCGAIGRIDHHLFPYWG